MDDRTEAALRDVLSADASFYQRARAVVQLLTVENVGDVVAALPSDFRTKFVHHAEQVYAPTGGERVVIGRRLPDTALLAIRAWLRAQNSATLVERVEAAPRSVRGSRPPRVVEVVGWTTTVG